MSSVNGSFNQVTGTAQNSLFQAGSEGGGSAVSPSLANSFKDTNHSPPPAAKEFVPVNLSADSKNLFFSGHDRERPIILPDDGQRSFVGPEFKSLGSVAGSALDVRKSIAASLSDHYPYANTQKFLLSNLKAAINDARKSGDLVTSEANVETATVQLNELYEKLKSAEGNGVYEQPASKKLHREIGTLLASWNPRSLVREIESAASSQVEIDSVVSQGDAIRYINNMAVDEDGAVNWEFGNPKEKEGVVGHEGVSRSPNAPPIGNNTASANELGIVKDRLDARNDAINLIDKMLAGMEMPDNIKSELANSADVMECLKTLDKCGYTLTFGPPQENTLIYENANNYAWHSEAVPSILISDNPDKKYLGIVNTKENAGDVPHEVRLIVIALSKAIYAVLNPEV